MLKLKIVSPDKIVFNGDVDRVLVPGTLGKFEILVNHAPIISSLSPGVVEYTIGKESKDFNITGGFVEVQKNVVNLCVEV